LEKATILFVTGLVARYFIKNMKFILGKKLEMSQIFDEKGNVIPVTLIEAGPCFVTQIKTKEKDGYEAIQVGFEKLKEKKVKKPQKTKPFKYLREFKGDISQYKVGQEINVSIFQEGEKVKISGLTKGKGFAGAVKRWGFVNKAKAHGAKDGRKLGSVGMRWPQRVIKGRKMAGRMGQERVTVRNLQIVKIDPENNILAVKGAVPGSRGTLLEIRN